MDAIEHLIHVAEDRGDEKLGGIAWGRMATSARTELSALKATASRAEALERVRIAAANVAAMYQTDPLLTVDGLTDTEFLARINTLRAAIKATCRECDGTGQGEPSWDGEKYNPRDCAKCGGSDAV